LSEVVLDASALIALVNNEPGGEKVRPVMLHAIISAVNFCETIQRLRRGSMPIEAVTAALTPLVREPVPFDTSLAYIAASIHEKTRSAGLSFADCACLALALSRNLPAMTTEREAWDRVDVGVRIIKLR
jgi:PIN domain nuclease of toxin-antitoxin system